MRQILRFYLRHDLDLIGLRSQGVSLGKLAKISLEAYANGRDIISVPPKAEKGDMKNDVLMKFVKKDIRKTETKGNSGVFSFKCEFSTNDPNSIYLLNSIKKSYRNQFIKTLIRNSLERQYFLPYFDNESEAQKWAEYENNKITESYNHALGEDRYIPIPTMSKSINIEDYLVKPKNVSETPVNKDLTEEKSTKESEKLYNDNEVQTKTKVQTEIKAPTEDEAEEMTETAKVIPYPEENIQETESDIISPISELKTASSEDSAELL